MTACGTFPSFLLARGSAPPRAHLISTCDRYVYGMTAQMPILAGGLMLDFDAACARVNQWRGQMVDTFARCEQAVTETLAQLNACHAMPEVKGIKFPHLVGQRYERLIVLLSATAQPSGHCKVALAALARFREHDPLRTMLCHGVTKVAVDRAGHWVGVMTLVSFKARETTTDKLTMEEDEAGKRLGQVIDDRRRVCAALGQVRRELAAG
jgi:hypothetical protein